MESTGTAEFLCLAKCDVTVKIDSSVLGVLQSRSSSDFCILISVFSNN